MIPIRLSARLFMVGVLVGPAARAFAAPRFREQREGFVPAVKLPDDFVKIARVPAGGIQPRVDTTADGLAVLYFKGDEARGDLFLVRSKDEATTFEASVQVNSTGPVLTQEVGHSGSLDAGPDGRAHVLWVGGGEKPSLQYVVEKPGGGLEPVQDLGSPSKLCRSTAIALDRDGHVFAFYAALDEATQDGETPGLRVWMRKSSDGTSFEAPVAIDAKVDGVSELCAMSALVDRAVGTVYVLYLTAGRRGGPEVRLLSSEDGGTVFTSKVIESAVKRNTVHRFMPHLSQGDPGARKWSPTIATWDTYGRAFWSVIDPRSDKLIDVPIEPKFDQEVMRRSRAVGLANGDEYLMAWLEQPVGDRSAPPVLNWHVWFQEGLLPLGRGRAPESPGSSIPAVFPNRAGGFTILY